MPPKDASRASSTDQPLPPARLHRLFRPYFTKLSTLQALFPSSPAPPERPLPDPPKVSDGQVLGKWPRGRPPRGMARPKTYARPAPSRPEADWTGTAQGLPVFARGKQMERAEPVPIPRNLMRIPGLSRVKGKGKEREVTGGHPSLPGIEMDEISKRVKGVVDAFRNILAVAYPLPNSDSPVPSLAVACARRVGIGMEGWIDDQLDEEFGPVNPTLSDEVGSKRESRRVELRDEWWEGVPHHTLRYAVPVQALSIVLALDLPLHGLYEGLLDACLQMGAAHEAMLLLQHMLLYAFNNLESAGPSYLPTLFATRPSTHSSMLPSWPAFTKDALFRVNRWMSRDAPQQAWVNDAVDGLVREATSDEDQLALILETIEELFSHSATQATTANQAAQRISSWTLYMLFLLNSGHSSGSPTRNRIWIALLTLQTLLSSADHLQPLLHRCTSVLNLHLLTDGQAPHRDPPLTDTSSVQLCELAIQPHTTLSTIKTIIHNVRIRALFNLEAGLLRRTILEYDRLSPFTQKRKPDDKQRQAHIAGLERLEVRLKEANAHAAEAAAQGQLSSPRRSDDDVEGSAASCVESSPEYRPALWPRRAPSPQVESTSNFEDTAVEDAEQQPTTGDDGSGNSSTAQEDSDSDSDSSASTHSSDGSTPSSTVHSSAAIFRRRPPGPRYVVQGLDFASSTLHATSLRPPALRAPLCSATHSSSPSSSGVQPFMTSSINPTSSSPQSDDTVRQSSARVRSPMTPLNLNPRAAKRSRLSSSTSKDVAQSDDFGPSSDDLDLFAASSPAGQAREARLASREGGSLRASLGRRALGM